MGVPPKMNGLFYGTSQSQMDDLVAPFLRKPPSVGDPQIHRNWLLAPQAGWQLGVRKDPHGLWGVTRRTS